MNMTVPYTLQDAGYDAVDCAPCDDIPWIQDIAYENWDHRQEDAETSLMFLVAICWRTVLEDPMN
jgi:hypothetical protein